MKLLKLKIKAPHLNLFFSWPGIKLLSEKHGIQRLELTEGILWYSLIGFDRIQDPASLGFLFWGYQLSLSTTAFPWDTLFFIFPHYETCPLLPFFDLL